MNTQTQQNLQRNRLANKRVQKIASMLRIGTWVLFVLLALTCLFIVGWLLLSPTKSDGVDIVSQAAGTGFKFNYELAKSRTVGGITLASKMMALLAVAIYASWIFYCLSRLHYLFGNFKRNKIFTQRNIQLIRNFGYALIIGIFLPFLIITFILVLQIVFSQPILLESANNLKISLGTDLVFQLIMIGTVFLSAWIMEIGCDLYIDREYTI